MTAGVISLIEAVSVS